MPELKIPLFENGIILKTEALDILRDYPREFLSLLYQEYGNGIVSGLGIVSDEEGIDILPGIWKLDRKFYYLTEKLRLLFSDYSQETAVIIRILEEQIELDFKTVPYEMILRECSDSFLQEEVVELEIGRFRLEKGAHLRTKYSDILDIETTYNTWNISHVLYAVKGGSTLHPAITKLYGSSLIKSKDSELDKAFSLMCLNGEAVSRQTILAYVSSFGLEISETSSVWELYKILCKRYIDICCDKKEAHPIKSVGGRRIEMG